MEDKKQFIGIILWNCKDRILSFFDTKSQKWRFPGKYKDANESPQDCILNSVEIQTGVEFTPRFFDKILSSILEYNKDIYFVMETTCDSLEGGDKEHWMDPYNSKKKDINEQCDKFMKYYFLRCKKSKEEREKEDLCKY